MRLVDTETKGQWGVIGHLQHGVNQKKACCTCGNSIKARVTGVAGLISLCFCYRHVISETEREREREGESRYVGGRRKSSQNFPD